MHRFAVAAAGITLSLTAAVASATESSATPAVRTDRCAPSPLEHFRPETELNAVVERLGYRVVRVGIDAGCYAVLADDRRGKRFDLRYEGANLRMVSRYLARREGNDFAHR